MFSRKQKIIFGFIFICSTISGTLFSPLVYADPVSSSDFQNAEYQVKTIVVEKQVTKVKSVNVVIKGVTYLFQDGDTRDDGNNLKPPNVPVGIICSTGRNGGIEVTGPATNTQNGNKSYPATISLNYLEDTDLDAIACVDSPTKVKPLNNVKIQLIQSSSGTSAPVELDPTPDDNTCKAESITSFEWWACPVLEGMDSIAQNLTKAIENLLVFNTSGEGDESYDNVYQAWNLFRYVASIVIVIVLFIMIIGQAISWGPFDAYTIRKLLPKLIAAAIIIQLSWPVMIFLINFFNDLGRGVADIMMYPFGGAKELELQNSLGEAMQGTSTVKGFGYLAILIAGGVLAALNIFLLLAVFIGIVASLLIGFVVLIVRKLLLIILIMLAPVAFAMWILPGTKRYWDMWQNTFIGLLMMFPIIMALLASGRILASVIADGGSFGGTSLPVKGLNAIMVLIAFFAPFWLIPKTFQWGGRAFGNIAGIMNDRGKGVFDRPKGFMQNRQKGINEERKRASAQRVASGKSSFIRGDQFRSGALDPTLGRPGSARRRRQQAAYVGAGFAVEEQEIKDQKTLMTAGNLSAGQLQDKAINGTYAESQAAISIMAQKRMTNNLQATRDALTETKEGNERWQKAINSNFGDIKESGVHLVQAKSVNPETGELEAGWDWDKKDLSAFLKAGDDVRSKMNPDTWRRFEQVAGSTEAEQAVQRIRGNENLAGNLARVEKARENIPGIKPEVEYSTDHPLWVAGSGVSSMSSSSTGTSGGGGGTVKPGPAEQEIFIRGRGGPDTVDKPATEWTPRDYAEAEYNAREEFNYLSGLAMRTPEQEQRLQKYRDNFPDWK